MLFEEHAPRGALGRGDKLLQKVLKKALKTGRFGALVGGGAGGIPQPQASRHCPQG